MTATLDDLRAEGEISSLDRALARSLSRLGGDARPEVLVATALVSRQTGLGNVCLDLPRFLAEQRAGAEGDSARSESPLAAESTRDRGWPALDAWLEVLAESRLVGRRDGPVATPLVLDGTRLYLRRCFEDERRVAKALLALAGEPVTDFDVAQTRASIARLLPLRGNGVAPDAAAAEAADEPDWPRVAAAVAASKRLSVISGGPGTGKTTTAARLLAVLVEQALAAGRETPRIALAAPTGKAAARLAEAIVRARGEMVCDAEVRDAIPDSAATLHRLLGLGPGRRRGASSSRTLRADVVLVDEASMVDLALMARLVDALPSGARLILLGDAGQLASVEAGSGVLGSVWLRSRGRGSLGGCFRRSVRSSFPWRNAVERARAGSVWRGARDSRVRRDAPAQPSLWRRQWNRRARSRDSYRRRGGGARGPGRPGLLGRLANFARSGAGVRAGAA